MTLSSGSYVATTTDGWSVIVRASIGLTVHSIDPNTIERRWVTLSCERFLGLYTYVALTGAIIVHTKFGIKVATTTDNASNFGKAFRMFGL